MQTYESLALIASAVTGGGEGSTSQPDPASMPKTAADVERALMQALGG